MIKYKELFSHHSLSSECFMYTDLLLLTPSSEDNTEDSEYLGLHIGVLSAGQPRGNAALQSSFQMLGFAYCMYTWPGLQDICVVCTLDQLL